MDEDTIDMMIRDANEILQSSSHSVIDETADKSVKLTQAAIDRVKKYLAKDDSLMYFRIGVADGGCNGQSYTYTTERVAKDDDMIVIAQDIRVLVRAIDLPKLDGCTLDFVETLAESSFKIINPNAQSTCGCGNSFS
jgi:iron-sulfur cluster assembly accessory protein